MTISLEEKPYIIDWILILAGTAVGLGVAWVLVGFGWSFPGELQKAQASGIVSITILKGYPKSRDLLAYLFTLFLPVAGAMLFWFFNRRSSNLGKNTLTGGFNTPTSAMWLLILLIPFMTGFFAWNISIMLTPRWSPNLGAWIFLGEQGATMAWVQSIIHGGVYGRDFFSLYGPMFIYPLTWLMDLLGNSTFVELIYKWALDTVAFAMLGFMFVRTLRARWLALIFIIIVFLIYFPQLLVSANTTILRSVLGMFPIVCIALWANTRQAGWFVTGGLMLGQSLLFSQEAGICATAAIIAMLSADNSYKKRFILSILHVLTIFSAILLISLIPMLVFLFLNGAGPGLFDSIIGYPKIVMMGYGGIPFPSLRDWLGGNFRNTWIHFAVISVYSASAIALCLAWLRGVRSARFLWALGLLIYGIFLFRAAAGRSDTYHKMIVMIPAITLSALWIDELWADFRKDSMLHWQKKIISFIMLAAVSINFFVGICFDPVAHNNIVSSWHSALSMKGKFTAWDINGTAVKEIPRLGQPVDEQTAISLREISHFLTAKTKYNDYVYFFPNEPVYYFLFNRTNPTRYPNAYWAATYERQREVIRDLERNRPQYVIYSKKTLRIDGIPEHIQIPMIVDFLNRNYKLAMHLQTVDIWERITAR